jgi:hypothetical protein
MCWRSARKNGLRLGKKTDGFGDLLQCDLQVGMDEALQALAPELHRVFRGLALFRDHFPRRYFPVGLHVEVLDTHNNVDEGVGVVGIYFFKVFFQDAPWAEGCAPRMVSSERLAHYHVRYGYLLFSR